MAAIPKGGLAKLPANSAGAEVIVLKKKWEKRLQSKAERLLFQKLPY
jgi:hypothetical protein|tara:strand:+ start:6337 stop:6477 length:141 start_codon:yes stop_codon:yes gene_type:complete